MYKNEWFEDRQAIKAPPLEAVIACSRPGSADEPVAYWVNTLNFDGPAWHIREFLGEYGAWSEKQLCDHKENLLRLFWIWCGNLREDYGPDFADFCGDGEEDKPLPATLYLGP